MAQIFVTGWRLLLFLPVEQGDEHRTARVGKCGRVRRGGAAGCRRLLSRAPNKVAVALMLVRSAGPAIQPGIVVEDADDQHATIRGLLRVLRRLDGDSWQANRSEFERLRCDQASTEETDRFIEKMEDSIACTAAPHFELAYERNPTTRKARYLVRRVGHECTDQPDAKFDAFDILTGLAPVKRRHRTDGCARQNGSKSIDCSHVERRGPRRDAAKLGRRVAPIPGGPVLPPSAVSLTGRIGEALARIPGSSAREIHSLFSTDGVSRFDRRAINRALYQDSENFTSDNGVPPRWRLRDGATELSARSSDIITSGKSSACKLYRLFAWQQEALDAWRTNGRRGIVQAVTGAGKTQLGIEASRVEIAEGGSVLVLVPSIDLMRQWKRKLAEQLPDARVGCMGGGMRTDAGRCDAVIAVVNSIRDSPIDPRSGQGLLIADECHRYGSSCNRNALNEGFARRLGLSATYIRADDGHLEVLEPYFGEMCYDLDYRRAIKDDVVAHFVVALLGVRFDSDEQQTYDDASKEAGRLRLQLINRYNFTADPFGVFMEEVANGAKHWDGRVSISCRQYLSAFERRRRVLAECNGKRWVLLQLKRALGKATGTIVFTESICGANAAVEVLDLIGVDAQAIHSELPAAERRAILEEFSSGSLSVIVAPRVLDEGIDVPEADLGVILAASRSHRQMVQRMGRVIRPKNDDRRARFVIAYVKGTSEDPALGAHETFLRELTGVADDVRDFGASADPHELCRYLNRLHAGSPVSRPRLAGEPPRGGSDVVRPEVRSHEVWTQ